MVQPPLLTPSPPSYFQGLGEGVTLPTINTYLARSKLFKQVLPFMQPIPPSAPDVRQ